jgi:phosphatidylglycerophosphate synthase
MQCNSILDGVDGELARVRFEQSKLGEWIDTVSDDLSNALFYGGLSLAAARLPSPGPTLGALGAAGVVLQLLTMALYYAELARLGRGDFYALGVGGEAKGPKGPVARVVTAVGYATKKDFFIFAFLVAAALGVLPWALVPIAIGTALTFFAGLGLLVKRLGSSTRRERNV